MMSPNKLVFFLLKIQTRGAMGSQNRSNILRTCNLSLMS